MTRQKKEIIKQVERVQMGMEMDDLMGCGGQSQILCKLHMGCK